jgi:hypothetical protein
MSNLPTFFVDPAKQRTTEVAAAQWSGGLNRGGSNAPGIGINTGGYDPKVSDWPNTTFNGAANMPYNGASGHIGLVSTSPANRIAAFQGADNNDTLQFVTTAGAIAPGGALITGVVNRTGLTVPSGARVWGTLTVAGTLLMGEEGFEEEQAQLAKEAEEAEDEEEAEAKADAEAEAEVEEAERRAEEDASERHTRAKGGRGRPRGR